MEAFIVYPICFYISGLVLFTLAFIYESEMKKDPLWLKIFMTILWPLAFAVMSAGWFIHLFYKKPSYEELISNEKIVSKSYHKRVKFIRRKR